MRILILIFLNIFLSVFISSTNSLAMSVDLGSEFMKIAIVMPRKPMEVALDGESKRKTPTAIGFRNDERVFGRAATNLALQRPELVFQAITPLIGKTLEHPTVQLFIQRYPYHKLRWDDTFNQLIFDHPNGMSFTVEELVAMLLEHARDIAESNVAEGTKLRSAVITVPYFWGQRERRCLLRAAELAGLDVLQLINTNAAVALDYGVYRHNTITSTTRNVMFFDLGYASTSATVVSYKLGKHYQDGVASEAPMASVIGVGSAPVFGTSTLIYRLRDHLASQFKLSKPTIKNDITKNNRAMAKLLQEASRVFVMLSANNEVIAQVEGLFEEQDFRHKVSRDVMNSIGADAFEQIRQPFLDALKASQLQLSDIDDIVLMGGGTRVPKVQEILMELGQRTSLGKGINSDEAAVMGAVYQAAASTPGFRVKRLVMRDYNPYAIAVDFERASLGKNEKDEPNDANTDNSTSFIRRILFTRGNPFPQKRAITFNRHTDDLSFFMNYAELSEQDSAYLMATNLSRAVTNGVSSIIKRHEQADLRGVKAHFTLDASGLLILTGVDCMLEPLADPASGTEEPKSAFQKLGNTISGFFSGTGSSDSKDANNATMPEANTTESDTNTTDSQLPKSNISDVNTTHADTNETKTKPPKKLTPFTERISFQLVHMDIDAQTDDQKTASKQKLTAINEADRIKRERENAMNELESSLFSTRELTESTDYKAHATSEDLTTIDKLVSDYMAWYDDQGPDTPREAFDERLSELRKLLIPIEIRVKETKQRPGALEKLDMMITNATQFSDVMRKTMAAINLTLSQNETTTENVTADSDQTTPESNNQTSANETKPNFVTPPILPPLFTDSEQEKLETSITRTKAWMEEAKQKLATLSPFEQPPILVADIEDKHRQLQREVIYLNKKLAKWQSDMELLFRLHNASQKPPTTTAKPKEDKTATPTETSDQAFESSSKTTSSPKDQDGRDEL